MREYGGAMDAVPRQLVTDGNDSERQGTIRFMFSPHRILCCTGTVRVFIHDGANFSPSHTHVYMKKSTNTITVSNKQ